jgi:DNA repair protein RecO (recombination protein O)
MHSHQTEAIILSTSDHGESDRLITFLTKTDGKIRGIAKGARRSHKRFVHSFEPFSLVSLEYRERTPTSLVWVDGCKLIEAHMLLREALDRWGYAALLTEVMVGLVPERAPQEALFVIMKTALSCLQTDKDPVNVVILALFRVLAELGYVTDLSSCGHCQRAINESGQYWLHLARGRLLCGCHEPPGIGFVTVDLGTLVLLRRARHAAPEQVWRLRLSPGRKTPLLQGLLEMVCAQLGKQPRSVKFLRDMGGL